MTTFYPSHQHYPAPLDQPTPQSPSSYMTRDHVGTKLSLNDSQSALGASPAIDTFSSRHSQNSGVNTIPTPTSAAGTVPPTTAHDTDGAMDDDVIDMGMGGQDYEIKSNGKRRGSISAEEQHDIYRNHDRSTGVKRSRSFDEGSNDVAMGQATPPVAVPSIKEILEQTDVHPLHLLCHQTYIPLYPSPTTSIFPLYNLASIAESVARQDSVTGAKKKLRKSYKGKIMELPGKPEIPKAVPRPTEAELLEGGAPPPKNRTMGLLEMLDWPEEEWRAQKVIGKDLGQPLAQDMLRRALTMATGPIPGFDPSSLGLDDTKKSSNSGSLSAQRATQTPSASIATPAQQQHHGTTPRGDISSASVSPAVMNDRSQRTRKKKRRYDDNSFEGYGEGYEDDELEDGGATAGGATAGGGGDGERRKKKKKKTEISTPGGLTAPNASYGR